MKRLGLVIGAIVAISVIGLVALHAHGVAEAAIEGARRIRAEGALGALVFAAVYFAAALLFVPHAALTVAAGYSYGLAGGFALSLAASLASAVAAFALGRGALRGVVARTVREHRRAAELDRAVHDRGLLVVVLVRIAPLLPFAAINYLFAMTGVRRRAYIAGTVIGLVPWTVLYAYLGSIAPDVVALIRGHGPIALPIVGGALAIAVTALLSYLARRALRAHLPP